MTRFFQAVIASTVALASLTALAQGAPDMGIPPNAIVARTPPAVPLLVAHVREIQKEDPRHEFGAWVNALDDGVRQKMEQISGGLAPDKRADYGDAEFMKAYQALGDVRKQPFCVFTDLDANPVWDYIGGTVYAWKTSAFTNPRPLIKKVLARGSLGVPGATAVSNLGPIIYGGAKFEYKHKPFTNEYFDPKKLDDSTYATLNKTAAGLKDNAVLRQCYQFLRYEEVQSRGIPERGMPTSYVTFDYLSADIVDRRTEHSVYSVPLNALQIPAN